MKNKHKLAHWYYRGRETCFAVLAITSAVVIYQGIEGYVPTNVIGLLIASAATFGFYLAIDGPLSTMLPAFFQERTSTEWDSQRPADKSYIKIVGVMAIGLLIVTGTVSLWSSYIIADGLVSRPDPDKIIAAVSYQQETDIERLERLERSLEQARNTYPERIRNAVEQGKNKVERARNAYKPEWARNFKAHMEYAGRLKAESRLRGTFSEWYNGVVAARRDSAALVDAEKTRLSDVEDNYLKASVDTASASIMAGIVDIGRRNAEYSEWSREMWASFFIIIDILMALGAIVFTFLLAKHENQYGEVIHEGRFSVVQVINAAFQGATQRPLAFWTKQLAFETVGTEEQNGTEKNEMEQNGTEQDGTDENGTDERSRGGTELTKDEKVRIAKSLHSKGKSYRDIVDIFSDKYEEKVSTSTLFRWINEK